MNGTLNVHRVFRGSQARQGYLASLNLSDSREDSLRHARDSIRKVLRKEMPDWNGDAKSHRLVEHRFAELASQLPPIRPKFRMQGSGVYHTLNNPAHLPPQEVDFDDGLFLPTSFVNGGGANRPVLASRAYFEMVQEILAPLCVQRGWELDTSKPSCVRVRIDIGAHIDLALYAIPDEEFNELAEARTRALATDWQTESEFELAEDIYRNILQERIMLAHRDSGWIESDPRKIEDWFQAAIKDHGDVVRRLCRYFKGWRDHQWTKGGPSSIALMACVVEVFDEQDGILPENRDDLALHSVANRLEDLFLQGLPNPVLPDQRLDENWTREERGDFVLRAGGLKANVDTVLNHTFHKNVAITKLREGFGERIPDDEFLIDVESEERRIRAYTPAIVAAPQVPRTTSG